MWGEMMLRLIIALVEFCVFAGVLYSYGRFGLPDRELIFVLHYVTLRLMFTSSQRLVEFISVHEGVDPEKCKLKILKYIVFSFTPSVIVIVVSVNLWLM